MLAEVHSETGGGTSGMHPDLSHRDQLRLLARRWPSAAAQAQEEWQKAMVDWAFYIFAIGLLDGVMTDGCSEKLSVFDGEPGGLSMKRARRERPALFHGQKE